MYLYTEDNKTDRFHLILVEHDPRLQASGHHKSHQGSGGQILSCHAGRAELMIRRCSFLQSWRTGFRGIWSTASYSDSGSVGRGSRAEDGAAVLRESGGYGSGQKFWRCRTPTTGIRSRPWRSATTRIIILSWRRMEKRSMLSISRRRYSALEEAFAKHQQRAQLHDRGTASAGGCGYADVRCVVLAACAGSFVMNTACC